MGSCLGRGHVATYTDDFENTITIGKSKPLTQERLKWKSDVPITLRELCTKRDEFWDTAPAFEGRKEIWDALKAAAGQAEQGDFALAQAILDGACIVLPDGTLRESYDELGCRYKVPVYCLSYPVNLVEEPSVSREVSETSLSNASSHGDGMPVFPVKLRLSSSGKDVCLMLKSSDTVAKAKQRLNKLSLGLPSPREQRWLFGGKLLNDRALVKDYNIPPGFVVQVDTFPKRNCAIPTVKESNAQVTLYEECGKEGNLTKSVVTCLQRKLSSNADADVRSHDLPAPVDT